MTALAALPLVLVFLVAVVSYYFVGDNLPGMFIRLPFIVLIADLAWRWGWTPHGSVLLLLIYCALAWAVGFGIAKNLRQRWHKQFLTFKQQVYATKLVFYSWFVVIVCMVLAAGMQVVFGPLFSKSAAVFFHGTLFVATATIMGMGWHRYSNRNLRLEAIRNQYSDLVDAKFSKGLTADEETELARLRAILDKSEEPFYRDVLKRIRARG